MIIQQLTWKTENEMQKELENEEKSRDYEKYGYDGHITSAIGEFEYKGIKYIVNVLRYYVLANPKIGRSSKFTSMGHRESEYFANLEYPESMNDIVKMVKKVREYSSFLYNDTLHSYCDKMDIDEQIQEIHNIARRDIDSLPKLLDEIDEQIMDLTEIRMKMKKIIGGKK